MELTHLQTFVTVAEERSISGAARRLFTTPSAISMQVKALETELRVQLFVRTPRGVELTDVGRHLKVKAQQTLQSAQEFSTYASGTQHEAVGRVTLGLNAAPSFLRIGPLVQETSHRYPRLEIHSVSASSGKILDDIKQGCLDVGFVFGDRLLPGFQSVPLTIAHLVIAAPRAWQSQIKHADWAELAQMPWICGDGYCPFQTLIDGFFEARSLSYTRRVVANDEGTRAELVASGVGLTLLEESEALSLTDTVMIHQMPVIPCTLSLVYASHRRQDPVIKAIVQCIQSVWNEA